MSQPAHLFDSYSKPADHVLFSDAFFNLLTFKSILDMDYPKIAPSGALQSFVFEEEVPADAVGTLIMPTETILHIDDVLKISRNLLEAFLHGKRSVSVQFLVGETIILFRLINNNYLAIQYAQDIIDKAFSLGLPEVIFERLLRTKINSPVVGLLTMTSIPIWKLGYLTGEKWVEEDIINATAELIYFKSAGNLNTNGPDILYLPTQFFSNSKELFYTTPRVYSEELLALRSRLQNSSVSALGFLICTGNHYTSVWIKHTGHIETADSLGGNSEEDLLEIMSWVFADLGQFSPSSVQPILVSQQASIGVGSGSCAIAANNFIERRINPTPTTASWENSISPQFRDCALRDLLLFHDIATQTKATFDNTTIPCVLWEAPKHMQISGFCGYDDYNMYKPLKNHPIYKLLELNKNLKYLLPTKSISKLLPLLDELASNELQVMNAKIEPVDSLYLAEAAVIASSIKRSRSQSLFECVDFTPRWRKAIKLERSPSIEISSPIPSRTTQAHSGNSFLSPILLLSSPANCSPKQNPRSPSIEIVSPIAFSIKVESESKPCINSDIKKESCTTATSTHCDSELKNSVEDSYDISPALGVVRVGSFYKEWEDARDAIYAQEEICGHKWIKNQSKSDAHGLQKVTFRCNRHSIHEPKHSVLIDPSDHRRGKTGKTGCTAHVNVCRNSGGWHVTTAVWDHNHERSIPAGGLASRPPTKEQHAIISNFATTTGNFNRSQLAIIAKSQPEFEKRLLEPHQISNIIAEARKSMRAEVDALGGDVNAIIASLKEKSEMEGWLWDMKNDEANNVTTLWWQSNVQAYLGRRYGDILLNDNTYNRNNCQFPLNVGIVIDNQGHSRNVWYAIQICEDETSFSWILQQHVKSAGSSPEVFVSDRQPSLINARRTTLPLTFHLFCLHHLTGNVDLKAKSKLSSEDLGRFNDDFWKLYRATSPEEFDRLWQKLIQRFPCIRTYLENEIYPCRQQWAYAWVNRMFTCGVRTNGRVESENRVSKLKFGPKTSLSSMYAGLNERTIGQMEKEIISARESSRRQHDHDVESVFVGPLKLLREHVGPYALSTCYREMLQSAFYDVTSLLLPDGMSTWDEYAIKIDNEIGFEWEDGEERHMLNSFKNDRAHISTKWLLQLITGRGMKVKHLFKITHIGRGTNHYIALMEDTSRYICDCCMGINLGIPCRHYFKLLSKMPALRFNIGVVRARWYKDPALDINGVVPVSCNIFQSTRAQDSADSEDQKSREPIGATYLSNPLDPAAGSRPTETLSARTVFHEATAYLRPLMSGIQTHEQLQALKDRLADIHQEGVETAQSERLPNPLIPNPKGRPRTQRLTGALEGPARGGGGGRGNRGRRRNAEAVCSVCKKQGHNRRKCLVLERGLQAGSGDDKSS